MAAAGQGMHLQVQAAQSQRCVEAMNGKNGQTPVMDSAVWT